MTFTYFYIHFLLAFVVACFHVRFSFQCSQGLSSSPPSSVFDRMGVTEWTVLSFYVTAHESSSHRIDVWMSKGMKAFRMIFLSCPNKPQLWWMPTPFPLFVCLPFWQYKNLRTRPHKLSCPTIYAYFNSVDYESFALYYQPGDFIFYFRPILD